jgi:hypothetical protein
MNNITITPGSKLVGDYVSCWVVLPMPKENVQSMLPKGLELAPQSITPEQMHPVMFAFGKQMNVKLQISSGESILNMNYLENITGVPYVQLDRELSYGNTKSPFLYSPRLFLNAPLPVFGGKELWGFEKEMANVGWPAEENYFFVNSQNLILWHKPIISLNFVVTDDYQPTSQFPNFSPIQQMMDQTLILQETIIAQMFLHCGKRLGYVGATFDWHMEQAWLRPIQGEVNIFQSYCPGLEEGTSFFQGIDKEKLGGFQLQNHWELSWPFCLD